MHQKAVGADYANSLKGVGAKITQVVSDQMTCPRMDSQSEANILVVSLAFTSERPRLSEFLTTSLKISSDQTGVKVSAIERRTSRSLR